MAPCFTQGSAKAHPLYFKTSVFAIPILLMYQSTLLVVQTIMLNQDKYE